MKRVLLTNGGRALPILILIAALSFILSGSRSLMSQTTMGRISGIVSDPSGAVVPNANLKLTNESTGVTVSTRSNSSGVYVFPNVLPGTYQLTVVASGFKTHVTRQMVVYVNQGVTENIGLTVGATTTSV